MEPEQRAGAAEDTAETYCYRHPDTPTRLRCSRCDRLICGRCATPASVGQHCPECVADARRSVPRVRSTMQATAPAVVAIIVITAGFYFAQLVYPNLENRFAMFPPLIDDGEWWRLLTPLLAHASLIHVGMNMLVLYVYGQSVEQAFGSVRFVILYLVSGLMGSAFSFAFGSGAPSIGASGAVFGVAGALVAFLYRRRTSQFFSQYLNGMLLFLAINALLGFALPNIDVFAHLGGLVAGFVVGLGFDSGKGTTATAAAGLQTAVALAVTGAAIALVALS